MRPFRKTSSGLHVPSGSTRRVAGMKKPHAARTAATKMSNLNPRTAFAGGNVQLAMEMHDGPLDRFTASQLPYDIMDEQERRKIRELCNTPDAPVWMADYSFKPMGEIVAGDKVMGWVTNPDPAFRESRRRLVPTTVVAVQRRMADEVVEITTESGRTIRCTPDHQWARGTLPVDGRSEYSPAQVGKSLYHVMAPTEELTSDKQIYAAGYIAAMIDGEGNWNQSTIQIAQSVSHNSHICARIEEALNVLEIDYKTVDYIAPRNGSTMRRWVIQSPVGSGKKTRQQVVDVLNKCHPEKMSQDRMDRALLTSGFGTKDKVVSIKSLGPGEVVSMQTETGNYTAWGFASKNCRVYYRTHNMMSTAVDIYSRFPVKGMEIKCKDPEIKKFYEELFFDELDYENFLIKAGREYWTVGEVNMMASWDEDLGVFEYEQILNADDLTVTPALFNPNEFRYHLRVPENLKKIIEDHEPRSDYDTLRKYYPEIVRAAEADRNGMTTHDEEILGAGFEISDVLLSRIVNGDAIYGTPMMMRAFVLLNLEEGLYAAQKAVADRLYSPFVLAKLGSPDLGDGEPWLPDEEQLQNFTDMMQQAMSARFRFLAYHFGIEIESVFGRESVPRFDQDFDRLESKMLEVWGIGEALLSGGTSGDAYASTALNAEMLADLMGGWQTSLKQHFKKRAKLIAEANDDFDYEITGGVKKDLMQKVKWYDDEGKAHVETQKKLLLPELTFATLNLRDDGQETQFYMDMRGSGIPISDATIMNTHPIDVEEEIEKIKQEKVKKWIAQAEIIQSAQIAISERGLPMPPELAMIQQSPVTPPMPNDITAPQNVPALAMDPNAMGLAQQNAEMMAGPTGAGPAPVAPAGPGVAPIGPGSPGSPNMLMPANLGGSRPQISDEQRGAMPKASTHIPTPKRPNVADFDRKRKNVRETGDLTKH